MTFIQEPKIEKVKKQRDGSDSSPCEKYVTNLPKELELLKIKLIHSFITRYIN